jgi:hypothetical protein
MLTWSFKRLNKTLYTTMYTYSQTSTSKDCFITHLKQIPIVHFLAISQALLPDPALASSKVQLPSKETM